MEKRQGYVNALAKTILGIFIIHEASAWRYNIWETIYHPSSWGADLLFPLYMLLADVSMFVGCAAIEWVASKEFKITWNKVPSVKEIRSFCCRLDAYMNNL